jgi:putative SOS response-associated peptidase YedK
MCGRFTRQYTWAQLHRLLDIRYPSAEEMGPSWNVAPTQRSPVCRVGNDGERELAIMRWGFTPQWSPDAKPGPINARCETVATNGMFRAAYRSRRCLVPISSFYEWRTTEAGKQPFSIRLLHDEVICLAGLWEGWAKDAEAIESFTVLTTTPNELMATIHNRMPVILRPQDYDAWLGAPEPPPELLCPFPAEEMEAVPVSTRVNSPRNNDAALCARSEPDKGLFG